MPGGRPPIYDAEKHPKECREMGMQGMFAVEMAKAWGVHTDTIENWKKEHPEFLVAYKEAQNFRTAWLLEKGRNHLVGAKDAQLNHTAWSMMMRYDGQNTDERRVKLKRFDSSAPLDVQVSQIFASFAQKEITPKEFNTLMTNIKIAAEVLEKTELVKKVEALEAKLALTDA